MFEEALTIICAIITSATAVIVAVIETGNRRRQKTVELRQARRETESRLSMELMSATLDLAYVTSLAVTGKHTNGNVEEAQQKAKAAQEEYEDFLRDEAAHAVAKM